MKIKNIKIMATKISKEVLKVLGEHLVNEPVYEALKVRYTVIDDKLTEVKFVSIRYDVDDSNLDTPTIKETATFSTHDNKELVLDICGRRFYSSPRDYEEDKPVNLFKAAKWAYLVGCAGADYRDNNRFVCDGKNIKEYVMLEETNGVVISPKDLQNFRYEYFPSRPVLYKSREEAAKYNDYEVQNLDGTVTVKHGYARNMRYNEEQQKLVGELLDLVKRMQEQNLELYFDSTDGKTSILPKNAFNAILNEDNDWIGEDEVADRDVWMFIENIPSNILDEDDTFVFKK